MVSNHQNTVTGCCLWDVPHRQRGRIATQPCKCVTTVTCFSSAEFWWQHPHLLLPPGVLLRQQSSLPLDTACQIVLKSVHTYQLSIISCYHLLLLAAMLLRQRGRLPLQPLQLTADELQPLAHV